MKRYEVWLVDLGRTSGSEIRKTRPGIIVSPDELNDHLNTVIVVPLTTGRPYAFRVDTRVQRRKGVAALDQIRTVDKRRLVKRLSILDRATRVRLHAGLAALFAP